MNVQDSSKACMTVSAFSVVKQSGGLILITLCSIPSSLVITWCSSRALETRN